MIIAIARRLSVSITTVKNRARSPDGVAVDKTNNREQFINRVIDEWCDQLDSEHLEVLVESSGTRMTECIRKDDRGTKY